MQQDLLLPMAPQRHTTRQRDGWTFHLTEREVMLLRLPITETSGGWQGAMREASTRVYPDRSWKVSHDLMRRLFRMCCRQGKHGGYQSRLPMRVLSHVFTEHAENLAGTYFYGRQEPGDDFRIKFGRTDNPPKRTTASTDNPRELRLIFCIWDPSGTFERRVKRKYAAYRSKGEWFFCAPEVRQFIQLCCKVKTTTELDVP